MEKKQNLSCPVCQGNSQFIFNKNEFDIYGCDNCQLKFVWPRPQNLAAVYQQKYFIKNDSYSRFGYTNYNEDKEPMRSVFEQELQKLEQKITGRKLFDVGAATGFFLDLAKKRGWQTAGCEISEYASQQAQNQGHKIYQGSLASLALPADHDLITMWDVLEHVPDPVAQLNKANKILVKGGYLLINTIDADSCWARCWGKKWNMIIPPEHLNFFSRKSLDYLLLANGFVVEENRKLAKKFSLAYIFKVLFEWQNFIIWQKLSRIFNNKFWRRFSIRINLRDNIFILAKKVKDV